jgi:hypothetical protein
MHLTVACGVAGRLNLLTYCGVCCAVSAAGALPATVICCFGDGFESYSALGDVPRQPSASGSSGLWKLSCVDGDFEPGFIDALQTWIDSNCAAPAIGNTSDPACCLTTPFK